MVCTNNFKAVQRLVRPFLKQTHKQEHVSPKVPSKAFVNRLIFLHVQFNKRLVTMSIPKLSEESSERPTSRDRLQIKAVRTEADFSDVAGGNDQAGGKFTEEEMAIHGLHRESCEVRWIIFQSDYRNFTWLITAWRFRVFCVFCSEWLNRIGGEGIQSLIWNIHTTYSQVQVYNWKYSSKNTVCRARCKVKNVKLLMQNSLF